jgi:hypothetical protein
MAEWDSEKPQSFGVVVQIEHPELHMHQGGSVVPGRDEVSQAQQALA